MHANSTMRIHSSRYVATMAPIIAPVAVVISRRSPRRTLESPLSTKTVDAPTEPAMIPIRLTATASVGASPKISMRTGTNMIPPPSPNSAPSTPAPSPMTMRPIIIIGSMTTHPKVDIIITWPVEGLMASVGIATPVSRIVRYGNRKMRARTAIAIVRSVAQVSI